MSHCHNPAALSSDPFLLRDLAAEKIFIPSNDDQSHVVKAAQARDRRKEAAISLVTTHRIFIASWRPEGNGRLDWTARGCGGGWGSMV